jgi:hypothetical protein
MVKRCMYKKSVIFIHLFDSGILLIIDLNKKQGGKKGISNFHHSPRPPPKGYKIVSLIINSELINSEFLFEINFIYKTTDIC